jgi:hypothetical protein
VRQHGVVLGARGQQHDVPDGELVGAAAGDGAEGGQAGAGLGLGDPGAVGAGGPGRQVVHAPGQRGLDQVQDGAAQVEPLALRAVPGQGGVQPRLRAVPAGDGAHQLGVAGLPGRPVAALGDPGQAADRVGGGADLGVLAPDDEVHLLAGDEGRGHGPHTAEDLHQRPPPVATEVSTFHPEVRASSWSVPTP